jgi:MFS family permease
MFDRRRLLIGVSAFQAVNALVLSAIVLFGMASPVRLLVFTLLAGAGTAFVMPIWHAIVPQLVPRDELTKAVTLNSLGINVARAVGPAIGGLLIATAGLAAPFALNAVSFGAVIAALIWWRQSMVTTRHLPSERFFGAIRLGLRYASESKPMRATMGKALAFFLFASCYWALLPLIARQRLEGGVEFYGLLVTAIGVGAVLGGLFLPTLKARLGVDRMVMLGTGLTGAVLVLFALVNHPYLALVTSLLAGASWIAVLANLNLSAQVSLPEWVRARGLAVFLTVYFGAMAGGSAVWGQVADMAGIETALLIAGAGAVLSIPATWRWRLPKTGDIDFTPSIRPEPFVAQPVEDDRGPVMVTIQYLIDPEKVDEFLPLLYALSSTKRRDGAFAWGVMEDVGKPGRYLEYFLAESWLEHMRQHERVTKSDAALQARVYAYHKGPKPPIVKHYVAPEPARR